MTPDQDTLRWIAKFVGRATPITVQSVGTGPYGLMEIDNSNGKQERTLRYIGFNNAKDAEVFAEFALEQRLHRIPAEMPVHPGAREQVVAEVQAWRQHQRDFVRLVPVCMNYAVGDALLSEIWDRSQDDAE